MTFHQPENWVGVTPDPPRPRRCSEVGHELHQVMEADGTLRHIHCARCGRAWAVEEL